MTFHLLAAAPDFPARLTQPEFCAVPSDTPIDPEGVRLIPSAGPYYVTADTPGQGVVLARNPNYRGSRARRLARIELTEGMSSQRAVSDVEEGTADYAPLASPGAINLRALAARLAARYGPGSRAARDGVQQFFISLHYGTGVFDGIRAYETPRGIAIFRSDDHLDRLFKSAALYYMPIPYTLEELRTAIHELIAANELRECYIRPIVFRGTGPMGLYPLDCDVEVSIAAWPWGAYLGEASRSQGVRAKVATWRRMPHDALIPHAKACGQYLNSVLAKIETSKAGYDEAILLDSHGFVSEGSAESIFAVRDGQILTPPQTAGIIDGINRKSIMRIARDLGYEVVERDLARAELILAEEVFMCGTAAGMVPVREIDDHPIGGTGMPGPITRELQRGFTDALHGRDPRYLEWLDVVKVASKAGADAPARLPGGEPGG